MRHVKRDVKRVMRVRGERKLRLLVLTPIAKPMNRFAACGDPRAETPKESKDD